MDCVGERLVFFSSVDDGAGVLSDEGGSFCPMRVLKKSHCIVSWLFWIKEEEKKGKKRKKKKTDEGVKGEAGEGGCYTHLEASAGYPSPP